MDLIDQLFLKAILINDMMHHLFPRGVFMITIDQPPIIKTSRLVLRQWSSKDLEPNASMNQDPRVREYFPNLLTKEESDHFVLLMANHIEKIAMHHSVHDNFNHPNFSKQHKLRLHVLYRLKGDMWRKRQEGL